MAMDRPERHIDSGGGAVVWGNARVAGDFVGRDQHKHYYLTQVSPIFMPRLSARDETRPPYPGLQPYRADDYEILTGREAKISEALSQIRDDGTLATVVLGPPDVGKTSFLAAGVLAKLDGTGADVFPMRDYGDAVSMIRGLLMGRAMKMALDVSDRASVPELARAIVAASPRRMIWVFDQFERFFLQEVGSRERDALQEALLQTLQVLEPHRFQLLIGIREDWQSALDRRWGDLLPGLRRAPVHLRALDISQAKVAILHPTRQLGVQPVFDTDLLDDRLLEDLDHLSPDQPGQILPADLQLVCQHLYSVARERGRQTIKSKLYLEATAHMGATWVLDNHFQSLMAGLEGAHHERAKGVAAEMLALEPGVWATADRLPVPDASPAEVAQTLEAMARAGLVVWHLADEQRFYAFATNSIARAAERALGREAEKRMRARRELRYVRRDWTVHEAWASRYQLNLLKDHYPADAFPAEEALVALRSAVTRQMPGRPWLERLEGDSARRLVRDLEDKDVATPEGAKEPTSHFRARKILGLSDEALPAKPRSQTFGSLSWAAAVHEAPACQEAAVLGLLSAFREKGEEGVTTTAEAAQEVTRRVTSAVEAARQGQVLRAGASRRTLTRLRGILADADDAVARQIRTYGPRARLAVWGWRVRRRISRDRRYILGIPAGGAVGAGLGLGILRFLTAPLIGEDMGFLLYSYFPTGFALGGALSLGLVLVNVLRLQPPEHGAGGTKARPPLLATLQGALFFAVSYLLLLLLLRPAGLLESPLDPPLALLAGAGLSYAVRDQPMAGRRIGIGRWAGRLGVAALAFALAQGAFVATDVGLGPERDLGTALMLVGWSGYTYRSALYSILEHAGLGSILATGNWFHVPAILDAALVGFVLALGLSAGLILAGMRHRRWTSVGRAGGD